MNTALNNPLPPMAVGRYQDADNNNVPLPFSVEEVERARRAYSRLLSSFHLRSRSNILITGLLHESAQIIPLERAVMSEGMVAISADSHLFDARRVESITRGFSLAGAIGITPETLTGLEQHGHKPEQLFADMVIWAKAGAYETLKQHPQLNVFRIADIGPVKAMECSHGAGVHVDRFEWQVSEDNGEIVLTSRLARSTPFQQYHTGVKGRVITSACKCGNIDPRIELTEG